MNKRKRLLSEHSMKASKEVYGNVHSIETFGAFDGPGVRYVLFLQGCPFRCKYCHNPDTWTTKTNKKMSVSQILDDYKKYKGFYKNGGLTVSGGEPMLQLNFLEELFAQAKKQNIHTCLDTSAAGFSPARKDSYSNLLSQTDLVMLDIKHIDNEKHIELTANSNVDVLAFARHLDKLRIKTIIRHVLVPTINDDKRCLLELRGFLDTLSNVIAINVLPYHKAGIMKWDQLGIKYPLPDIEEPNAKSVEKAEEILMKNYRFYK